jgi:hypothetical protein
MEFSGITVSHQVFIKRKFTNFQPSQSGKTALSIFVVVSSNFVFSQLSYGYCIIRDINTVFWTHWTRSWFGNPNLFYRLQKRLCTRLAIPSQSGLHWKRWFYPTCGVPNVSVIVRVWLGEWSSVVKYWYGRKIIITLCVSLVIFAIILPKCTGFKNAANSVN